MSISGSLALVDDLGWPRTAAPDRGVGSAGRLTVRDFLDLPVTAAGRPLVLAGESGLDRAVRWLHVSEFSDPHGALSGGELILTGGAAFPGDLDRVGQWVAGLVAHGVSGVVVELGRRFEVMPPSIVRAFESRHLPLVVLRRAIPFVQLTEVVHARLLDGQRELLELRAAVHQRFTELSLADVPAPDLVQAAAELAEGQVVFTNLLHQVLAVAPRDGSVEDLLARWERRSRLLRTPSSAELDAEDGSIVVPVDVRGRQYGWLGLFTSGMVGERHELVMERAAAALTMRVLIDGDAVLVDTARRSVLTDIISHRFVTPEAIHQRAEALGHQTRDRHYLPVVVLGEAQGMPDLLRQALSDTRLPALVGAYGEGRWAVLALLRRGQDEAVVDAFASRLHQLVAACGHPVATIGVGGTVGELHDVRRSFAEASDVAVAARGGESLVRRRSCYRIQHIQLRGLLYTLREDPRLQAFVQRTLGPLMARDAHDGGDLVRTLACYLKLRGNKSLAAQEIGISRPTLYERLARIQRMLDLDLGDPEASASLYASIMVVESLPAGGGRL